jgi:hypothetical protein
VAYSNTYNFYNNTQIDSYIKKAFERCGIMGDQIVGLKVDAAILDFNLMLSEWANKGLNLFTEQKLMFQINQGQPSYLLPQYLVEALEVTASNNLRLLGGTPFSSAGGVAGNCFNGNPQTPTTQTAPDGYISYTYPAVVPPMYPLGLYPAVYYVGVQSYTNTTYSLVYEYTLDGVLWNTAMTIPTQLYMADYINWFVVPAPLNAMSVRIRETMGATLNIAQLFFSRPQYSRILTAISRAEWISYPNKQVQATPSSFYIDRQESPLLTLWPTPDQSYQTIVYNATLQIMDVSQMNQNVNIPQRFMETSIAGLAARMALIFAPDKFELLDKLSSRAFDLAAREDVENVPMRIMPNIYYT